MTLNELAKEINDNAKNKGFWDKDRNFAEMLMLAVSELSEALDEYRSGKPLEYIPLHKPGCKANVGTHLDYACIVECSENCKPEGVAVELADALIRILDTIWSTGVDIDGVVARKMDYNSTRPYMHGKKF